MPLPNFDDFRMVWVEKTKSSHGHGGKGYEFGTCLRSPTTDKSGNRIYKNMAAARDGDLVLHFYEDTCLRESLVRQSAVRRGTIGSTSPSAFRNLAACAFQPVHVSSSL